jgi:hypothetical protein
VTLNPAFDQRSIQRRQRALEALYRLDGRQSVLHPLHGRYSGLVGSYPPITIKLLEVFG